MAEVIWTEPALRQLDAVLEFIALDKPEAAESVASRVFAATDRLKGFVQMGRKIPEFPHKDYRQVWITPCWFYYRIEEKRVVILHVRRAERMFRMEDLVG